MSSDLSGKRPLVRMFFDTTNQASALFDTGSAVTLLSTRAFRKAKKSYCVGAEIKNHGLSLRSANAGKIQVVGVFYVNCVIAGRNMRCPMVVADQLTSEAIIGINLMRQEGIMYDPTAHKVILNDTKPRHVSELVAGITPEEWKAHVIVARATTIQPMEARLVRCRLQVADSEAVLPSKTFITTIMGNPVLAASDKHGNMKLYVANNKVN